jgi:hypothetical protein
VILETVSHRDGRAFLFGAGDGAFSVSAQPAKIVPLKRA